MKDIHEVKDNQPPSQGCGRKCAFNMDWKLGQQQHHSVLRGFHQKSTNTNTAQHQKADNDVSPAQQHNLLPAWVEQVHLHTFNNLSDAESLSGSEQDWRASARPMDGAW